MIDYNMLETFQIQIFYPILMCLIFSIVIHAVKEVMYDVLIKDVLPSSQQLRNWTNFAICTTEVMVACIVSLRLSITPGYQIYISFSMNVSSL